MGDPQHHMAAAMYSAMGVQHSRTSAVREKRESRGPQPEVQHSGHVSLTALETSLVIFDDDIVSS